MISICRHIKTDGARCKGAALRSLSYCYIHDRLHRVLNRRKCPKNSFMLHPLENRDSVFLALSDVVCGLAAGRVNMQTAARLIHGLQVAGKYAPNLSSEVAQDAVKSLDLTITGDELAPELWRCTDEDHCDSCKFIGSCGIEKFQAWRAAHAGNDEQDQADDTEEDGNEDENHKDDADHPQDVENSEDDTEEDGNDEEIGADEDDKEEDGDEDEEDEPAATNDTVVVSRSQDDKENAA